MTVNYRCSAGRKTLNMQLVLSPNITQHLQTSFPLPLIHADDQTVCHPRLCAPCSHPHPLRVDAYCGICGKDLLKP